MEYALLLDALGEDIPEGVGDIPEGSRVDVCHRQTKRVPNAVPVSLHVHSAFRSSLIKHPTYLSDLCHYMYIVLSEHLSSSTPLAFRTFFTFTLLPGSSALLHETRTRVFRITFFRTWSSGHRFFSYQAPTTWNQLSVSVRHATSA